MNILLAIPYILCSIGRGAYLRLFRLLRAQAEDHAVEMFAHDIARGMRSCRRRFDWCAPGQEFSGYYSEHFQPAKDSHAHN